MSLRDLEKINVKKFFGLIVIFLFFVWCLKQIVDDNSIVVGLVFLFVLMLATSSELKYLSKIFGRGK
jgi:hypothetical protein